VCMCTYKCVYFVYVTTARLTSYAIEHLIAEGYDPLAATATNSINLSLFY